jgi:protein-tyrosine phosphatase
MVESADLVVCMAADHRAAIVGAWPAATDKTFTIKELVRLLEGSRPSGPLGARIAAAAAARNGTTRHAEDIRDPLGEPLGGYREVADELHDLSGRLAAALTGDAA